MDKNKKIGKKEPTPFSENRKNRKKGTDPFFRKRKKGTDPFFRF